MQYPCFAGTSAIAVGVFSRVIYLLLYHETRRHALEFPIGMSNFMPWSLC